MPRHHISCRYRKENEQLIEAVSKAVGSPLAEAVARPSTLVGLVASTIGLTHRLELMHADGAFLTRIVSP